MDFKKIKLEDFNILKPFLSNEGEASCESTFISLFVWADFYDNSYCVVDNILFMRSLDGEEYRYSIPFCKNCDLEKAVKLLTDELYPQKPCFWAQEGARFNKFKELFCENYVFFEEEDAADYIYLTEDLSTLRGKKYHSKRNHIANFSKSFDWEYATVNDKNKDLVKECAQNWYNENLSLDDDNSLLSEKEGIFTILDNLDVLKAKGGCVLVDGKVIAFAIGSPINNEVFDIHFEKALADFQGAYSVINREFAKNDLAEYKYINREDDLGIEGLRKAKLSYKPVKLLNKYLCDPKRYTKDELSQCRGIYENAFGKNGEFDDILFEKFQNTIELLKDNNKVVSMLFRIPCTIVNNGVSLDAYYVYAVATKENEQHKGYASKLLEKAYGDGSKVFFLKPFNSDLVKFYEQNGYKVANANAMENKNLYVDVLSVHSTLSTLCDIPKTDYTLMYRYDIPLDLNGISFLDTLE